MIKFYSHDMASIGNLSSNTAGSYIALMDKLCDGFGDVVPTSITVTSGIGVMAVTGHSFITHCVMDLDVTGEPTLTGEFKVTATTSTTVTFKCPGVADGTYSTTIAARVPGIGMEKVFTGTNKGAYRFTSPEASQAYLRIEDTNATAYRARVRMYESMSGIDTGTNPSPSESVASGGAWIFKGSVAANLRFYVVSDGRFVYFSHNGGTPVTTYATFGAWFFGDMITYRSNDAFPAILFAASSNTANQNSSAHYATTGAMEIHSLRYSSGIGNGGQMLSFGQCLGGSSLSGSGSLGGILDERMFIFPRIVLDGNQGYTVSKIRGIIPGYGYCPQGFGTNSYPESGTIIEGTGDYAGKNFLVISANPNTPWTSGVQSALSTYFLIDLDGPWR